MKLEEFFPENVQEILKIMRLGPLLMPTDSIAKNCIKNIHVAMEMQQDEEIKKPYRYIIDITEDASGEIDSPPFDEKKKKLRELTDNFNYFESIREYLILQPISDELSNDEITDLSEAIYEDLILCAEARLMMKDSHPYFEKMLNVYKSQGFPCAWTGGRTWKKGDFVIYFYSS